MRIVYGIFVGGVLSMPIAARAGVLTDAPSLSDVLLAILETLLTVAGGVAVIVLVVSGIVYLTAGGNSAGATRAKNIAYNGVIGSFIALGSMILLRSIIAFLQ